MHSLKTKLGGVSTEIFYFHNKAAFNELEMTFFLGSVSAGATCILLILTFSLLCEQNQSHNYILILAPGLSSCIT